MLKITRLAAFAILGVIAAGAYAADTPASKVAATVNGVSIPQELVDFRVSSVLAQGQQSDTPELRKAILEDLINVELMSQAALKEGMDKNPEVAMQLGLEKEKVLVGALVQDYVKKHPIADAAISQQYDKLKETLGAKEVHVRHILVKTEKEAQSIEAKLKKGAKFDALAKRYSTDAGSREHGGDLGWIPVGKISSAFVKPFGDALMGLGKGKVSEPVESQFGWHIIQLEDERELKMPTIDQLKPKITQLLQQQAVKKMIADLREKAKISE